MSFERIHMNKYTVALCYFAGVSQSLLDDVRGRLSPFGYRAEYLVEALADNSFGRGSLSLGRGYDMVVIITDGASPHMDFDCLKRFNHVIEDPWATTLVAVSSSSWKGYQTVISIESERYLGHFRLEDLPVDLFEALQEHRGHMHDRGLTGEEWRSIESYATPEEWKHILVLRGL
jgi:hypothetical protein